jgi:hypothetical protein
MRSAMGKVFDIALHSESRFQSRFRAEFIRAFKTRIGGLTDATY